MNAVKEKLPALIEEELEAANVMHKIFHSPHEGFAVMAEEVDEMVAEMEAVEKTMKELWGAVKLDDERYGRQMARMIEVKATRAAAEAIQVAAMARKFQAIEKGAW